MLMPAIAEHRPVLLQEAVQALAIRSEGIYLDATFGRGGHAAAILSALGPEGRLFAIDQDPDAQHHAHAHFSHDERFHFSPCNFSQLAALVSEHGLTGQVNGVLLDLGVSSPQLDDQRRGFSFMRDGPLDMRMNPTQGVSAAEWLATIQEADLIQVLRNFGEERFAKRIARAIVKTRQQNRIERTTQLANLIAVTVPARETGKHPATRSFQAIRIAVNDELGALEAALEQALLVLTAYGRLVVISFHSLEDRLVKRFMRTQAQGQCLPPDLPVRADQPSGATLRIIGRCRPSADEVADNVRARSAVMRTAERLP